MKVAETAPRPLPPTHYKMGERVVRIKGSVVKKRTSNRAGNDSRKEVDNRWGDGEKARELGVKMEEWGWEPGAREERGRGGRRIRLAETHRSLYCLTI